MGVQACSHEKVKLFVYLEAFDLDFALPPSSPKTHAASQKHHIRSYERFQAGRVSPELLCRWPDLRCQRPMSNQFFRSGLSITPVIVAISPGR